MSQRLAVMDAGRVVQVGTPVDVYEHPATAYVADFLGVANLLDADGDTARDGRRTVRLGSFVLDAGGEGPAGPVKLVIRPERVHVAAGEATGPNCIPAMVERVVYVGSTTRVHVRLPGGEAAAVADHQRRAPCRTGRPARPSASPCPPTPCGRSPPSTVTLHGWSADHDRLAGELARRIRGHWSGRTPRSDARRRRRTSPALAAITPPASGSTTPCVWSTRCCCRTTSPSTTRSSSPTSRPLRRRRPPCSTPSSGRGRSPARAGRRPAPPSPPRTPPSTGCARSPGCPTAPAAASCPVARRAT